MSFNFYTPKSPPTGGNAKKIWDALLAAGFKVQDLHYNPNCWQRPGTSTQGWGTWAFSEDRLGMSGFWCGIHEGRVYISQMSAPFAVTWLGKDTEVAKERLGQEENQDTN